MSRGLLLTFVWLTGLMASASQAATRPRDLRDGGELYRAACAACHGDDGAGAAPGDLGFDPPETFPDFSDCSQATPEQDIAWRAMIRDGGKARGFSEIMPAFGGALDAAQIVALVRHLRGFCHDPRWPRGELNVPRALVTEKAFPENETVVSAGFTADGSRVLEGELGYEQRIGARSQLEIALPFASGPGESGGRSREIGDLVFGFKHVLHAHYDDPSARGSIFAVQGEVSLPTGSASRGVGAGTPVFSVFGAWDQLLPGRGFLQVQGGVDLPRNADDAPRTGFLRSALGLSIAEHGGYGRTWSPMLEFAGERPLDGSESAQWDVIPELQVTLSARQHVRAALGWQRALTQRHERPGQVLFYLLWDWADGALGDGW